MQKFFWLKRIMRIQSERYNENSVREVHKIVIFKKRIIIKMNVIKGKKLFF